VLQLHNQTRFAAGMFLFPDEAGIDAIYTVVKATFDIVSGIPEISEEQRPVQLSDEYYGEPGASSLERATEAHLSKPGTDVVVVGDAIAPDGRAVKELMVSLEVGERRQAIRVVGDRSWKGTALKSWPGDPAPFVCMPLVYERAFGGMQILENSDGTTTVNAEPFNPVGRGFRGARSFEEIRSEPVPNLEDPDLPVTSMKSRRRPVGFGFVAPSWAPRYPYAGTYDAAWRRSRAPYLPRDFDARFFNTAPADWVFEEGLTGKTPIVVENMSETGVLAIEMPTVDLAIEVVVAGAVVTPKPALETVLIEPNDAKLFMTFRAKAPCDKKALEVSEVRILG
jgi:hypothetical protein